MNQYKILINKLVKQWIKHSSDTKDKVFDMREYLDRIKEVNIRCTFTREEMNER